MILIPISTDAPIYYRPIGTLALIVLNVAIYLVIGGNIETAIERYGLQHSSGLTPFQWITSNFVHGGFFHLLFNMIFLWGFGIIIEGKIGWMQFIPLYLGIGVVECFVEQLIYSDQLISFGASAIIYGLMVITLIWAPANELTVFYWVFFRFVGVFEISIVAYSLLMLATSLLFALVLGDFAYSEWLHLLGGAVGAIVGFAYLQLKLVDCEGWDLLSYVSGQTPNSDEYLSEQFQDAHRRRKSTKTAKRVRPEVANSSSNFIKASPKRFARLLENSKAQAAYMELLRLQSRLPDWSPSSEQLLLLARGLRRASAMKKSMEIYNRFLNSHPNHSSALLEVAEILVYVEDRPSAAKKRLERCQKDELSAKQQARLKQAMKHAQSMIDDGVIEIDYQE
ncbi:Rhomboid family protein [Thalassoglobus neptunius]|uniref:Rhomboid family protein n=1 Tax=Thalassoglobus neptunius TaxID=1938619 RepID=A0A5C5X698_9PLAN|nr:rhomboid family intramembrane serine protease [Thalassoglobus neptunius]TWT58444.1 Rhomboid family protein [Thalassoglobus neptunius]